MKNPFLSESEIEIAAGKTAVIARWAQMKTAPSPLRRRGWINALDKVRAKIRRAGATSKLRAPGFTLLGPRRSEREAHAQEGLLTSGSSYCPRLPVLPMRHLPRGAMPWKDSGSNRWPIAFAHISSLARVPPAFRHFTAVSGNRTGCGVRPRLQRRVRGGFSPHFPAGRRRERGKGRIGRAVCGQRTPTAAFFPKPFASGGARTAHPSCLGGEGREWCARPISCAPLFPMPGEKSPLPWCEVKTISTLKHMFDRGCSKCGKNLGRDAQATGITGKIPMPPVTLNSS